MRDPEGVQGGKRVTDVTLPMNRELAQGTVPILCQGLGGWGQKIDNFC